MIIGIPIGLVSAGKIIIPPAPPPTGAFSSTAFNNAFSGGA